MTDTSPNAASPNTPGTPPAALSHEDRTVPAIIYALYLFMGVMFGLPALVGVVLAYANLGNAGPMVRTHLIFQIRTVWIGAAWAAIGGLLILVGAPLSLILIGIPLLQAGFAILSLIYLWVLARCVAGGIYLSQDAVYPRPRTWLI
ncbi:MAG: hypothetical protein P4L64_04490 [Caulobacteraceae bacterium]|nr:hypothetical protein [Caulobacteraceae bacterium]